MRKILFLVTFLGSLVAACGQTISPPSTATNAPSPTVVPTQSSPTLIREVDLETQSDTAYTLDWSPDGETLAVASGFEITLLSSDLNETRAVLKPENGALSITWNPTQTQFATVNGYRNPTIRIWDWDSANKQLMQAQQLQADSDQYGVFWSPNGELLVTLADDNKSTFQTWDANTGEELHKYELPYTNTLRTFDWNSDSLTFYGAGESKGQLLVYALNVGDGSVREVADFPTQSVAGFAFSPNESKLAVSDERGVVEILDLDSGKAVTAFKSVDQPVDLAWNPNGRTLAILDYKTKLQLWDVSS